MSSDSTQFWMLRLGGGAAVVGSAIAMVGNLLHPATPTRDPHGVAHTIASTDMWVAVHVAIVLGLIIMAGGFAGLYQALRGGAAGAVARMGFMAAIAGTTVGLILVILDGVAAKHIADAWASAPLDESAAALRILMAEETMNFALASLFNILFAGVTFILFGVAVLLSSVFPRWLGWPAVVAGVGSVLVGLVQAQVGESTGLTRIATIIFPTIITLWTAVIGILLIRRSSALADTVRHAGDPAAVVAPT